MDQDATLSRLRPEFESPWGHLSIGKPSPTPSSWKRPAYELVFLIIQAFAGENCLEPWRKSGIHVSQEMLRRKCRLWTHPKQHSWYRRQLNYCGGSPQTEPAFLPRRQARGIREPFHIFIQSLYRRSMVFWFRLSTEIILGVSWLWASSPDRLSTFSLKCPRRQLCCFIFNKRPKENWQFPNG